MPNPINDKLQTLDAESVARIYKTVFDSEAGQLALQDLINRCYYDSPLPVGQEGDRCEGMRLVVLHIKSQINYEPEKIETESDE